MRPSPRGHESPTVADQAWARLSELAGQRSGTVRRRLAVGGQAAGTAADADGPPPPVLKKKLTANGMAEPPPLLDEEVELSLEEARDGGGIDPRFLAEIFPQMRGMLERSDLIEEVGEDMPRVAEPMAMQDQEEEKTTAVFKRRLASLVREVAVAQKSGGPVVRASALAVAGDGSKGVHSRVLANAKQFWGLKASEARGKFEAFAAVYYHFGPVRLPWPRKRARCVAGSGLRTRTSTPCILPIWSRCRRGWYSIPRAFQWRPSRRTFRR